MSCSKTWKHLVDTNNIIVGMWCIEAFRGLVNSIMCSSCKSFDPDKENTINATKWTHYIYLVRIPDALCCGTPSLPLMLLHFHHLPCPIPCLIYSLHYSPLFLSLSPLMLLHFHHPPCPITSLILTLHYTPRFLSSSSPLFLSAFSSMSR